MTTVIEFYISDKERKKSKKILSQHFKKEYCKDIEQGFYDHAKQYCLNNKSIEMGKAIYVDSVKNLIFNCEQNNNTIKKIKEDVNKQKYNGYNIAFLRPEELDKDNWIKIILRQNTTEEKLNNLPTIEWKKCHNCQNIHYYYYQMQTRSADEPMTTFYICRKCNKTYRKNN